jgi:hypothetical protein
MLRWFWYGLAILALLAVVPLFVWANTGRLSSARYALKRYLLCLAILGIPALVVVPAYWFMVSP